MPTPNLFVTSANQNQSLYITREEVIEAISSIGTLSSFNIGYPTNASFSSITLPATGQISGFAPIQTSNVVFAPSPLAGMAQKLRLGSTAPALSNSITSIDVNNSNAPLQGNQLTARSGLFNGTSIYQAILPQSNVFYSANGLTSVPYILWNGITGAPANIALTNISSINGSPPNVNPTSYTNLSGNNITNSQVVTTPSIVGVSSLNALPISRYINSNAQPWVGYTVTNTTTYSFNLVANAPATVLTFTNTPTPNVLNRSVGISVPISVNVATPVSQVTTVRLSAFVGGGTNAGFGVNTQITITPTTTFIPIMFSGVANTTGSQTVLNIVAVSDGPVSLTFTQGSSIAYEFYFQTLGF